MWQAGKSWVRVSETEGESGYEKVQCKVKARPKASRLKHIPDTDSDKAASWVSARPRSRSAAASGVSDQARSRSASAGAASLGRASVGQASAGKASRTFSARSSARDAEVPGHASQDGQVGASGHAGVSGQVSQASSRAGSRSPTASEIVEVFAADTEEQRTKRFEDLRSMMGQLTDINKRLKRFTTSSQASEDSQGGTPRAARAGTPRGSRPGTPRGSVAGEGAGGVAHFVNLDESEDEAVDPDVEAQIELQQVLDKDMSSEEQTRLLALLCEQYQQLVGLLTPPRAPVENDSSSRLINHLLENEQPAASAVISSMRPQELLQCKDAAGLTALHFAVRLKSTRLVWEILEKAPELANVPTFASRTPPRFSAYCFVFYFSRLPKIDT